MSNRQQLAEVAAVFLKLGTIAFGGPAAHIAMMNEEIVQKRKWVDQDTFLDLLGAANLIPGPNSTELAIHLGYRRAGRAGLIVAGVCFILPAMLIVLGMAILYHRYGQLPQISALLYGVKPVIIAIVLQALWGLTRTAVKNRVTAAAGLLTLGGAALGAQEILLLVLAGALVMLIQNRQKLRGKLFSLSPLIPFCAVWPSTSPQPSDPSALGKLFWLFLKMGSVLYGSGYVLLAFLQSEFVERWQVLAPHQLLDAVAVGQFTPGPVFTTATFVGYLIAGIPGAILATVGIFLPAFVFVALVNPWIDRLRSSSWTGSFLDGVNAASLALMTLVTGQLALNTVIDWFTLCLTLTSTVLLFRFNINSAWLILAGGALGLLFAHNP